MSASTLVKNYGSFGKNSVVALQNVFVQKDSSVSQTATLASPLFFRWNGMSKFFDRPTTDAFCIQAKSEYTGTAASHALIEATTDWKGNGTTGGRIQAVQAVGRVASTYTLGAGTALGSYAQFKNDGTINSASAFAAASYHLVEAGGVYTAVGHVAASWFDSHLAQAVTSGSYQLQYLTNNGSTQMDQVWYVYGGNKTTALIKLDTCGGMVDTGGTLGGTLKKIKIDIDGTPYYLIAGTTVS